MGHFETVLETMFREPRWRAPNLGPLGMALGALERTLGDLAQADPDTWSGAAADGAAEAFSRLQKRYKGMQVAIQGVVETVETANQARESAYMEFCELPSAAVPNYVDQQVRATTLSGQSSVWIAGKSYPSEGAINLYEQRLMQEREAKARALHERLEEELKLQQEKLKNSQREIQEEAGITFDEENAGPRGGSLPMPSGYRPNSAGGGPNRSDFPDYPGPGYERPDYEFGPGYDRDRVVQSELKTNKEWRAEAGVWTSEPSPRDSSDPLTGRPLDPWQRSSEGIPSPEGRYSGLDVDSGSRGTIGNPGLNGGLLGGAGLAGGAALRWRSQGGTMGPNVGGAGGPGGAGGIGGVGGIGGAAGAGGAGAPGAAGSAIAGGRGLAGGLPGGGAGAAGTGAGSNAAAGAGARGGMVSGGTPMGGRGGGAGGGGGSNGKKSGLGGHVAPKLEDDEDFMPQSDSARAGSRDDLEY